MLTQHCGVSSWSCVMEDKICIWHCFLVDKGSDRYASPDTGRAEGECLYRRQIMHFHFSLDFFTNDSILQNDVPKSICSIELHVYIALSVSCIQYKSRGR